MKLFLFLLTFRSLVALSLVLSLLLFKPAPLYILDEVDAALDLSHTQNIGQMLRTHFTHSQVCPSPSPFLMHPRIPSNTQGHAGRLGETSNTSCFSIVPKFMPMNVPYVFTVYAKTFLGFTRHLELFRHLIEFNCSNSSDIFKIHQT